MNLTRMKRLARRWATLAAVRVVQAFAFFSRGTPLPKVLVVKADGIGDFVCSTPLLQVLAERHGAGNIDLVTSRAAYELARACPLLDKVWVMPAMPLTGSPLMRHTRHLWRLARLARRELAKHRYGHVLVARWDESEFGETTLAAMTGGPDVRGFSEKCAGRDPRDFLKPSKLLGTAIITREQDHESQLLLQILPSPPQAPPPIRLWWSTEDEARADSLLSGLAEGKPLVAVGPGASLPRKIWPAQRFAEVMKALPDACFVVVGTERDGQVMSHLDEETRRRVLNLTGKLTLPQCAALMRRCTLFIGNDSGPKHLALAAGVPCVEISCLAAGDSDEQRGVPVRFGVTAAQGILLRPVTPRPGCERSCGCPEAGCITAVSTSEVLAAACKLLTQTQLRPTSEKTSE